MSGVPGRIGRGRLDPIITIIVVITIITVTITSTIIILCGCGGMVCWRFSSSTAPKTCKYLTPNMVAKLSERLCEVSDHPTNA